MNIFKIVCVWISNDAVVVCSPLLEEFDTFPDGWWENCDLEANPAAAKMGNAAAIDAGATEKIPL